MTDRGRDHLIGHVDQADEAAIVGWLANLDHPGRLETVTCVGACGGRVAFQAWHMREDVCAWFGIGGRFGFSIPAAALGGLRGPITLRDRQGTVLTNGEALEGSRRGSAGGPEATTIFLHIPKTAGTSLRNALVGGMEPSDRLFLYPEPFGLTVQELAALPIAQRRAAHWIVGHAYFGIDRFLGRNARYLTFLREPLARLRSHAAHHRAAGTVFRHAGETTDLAVIVEEGQDEEFDNLMVRSIAGLPRDIVPLGAVGEEDVALALFNIERHFAFVGLVERMERDVSRLGCVLGRTIGPVGRENVARDAGSDILDRMIDWDRVVRRNRFDRMLYDRVRASLDGTTG